MLSEDWTASSRIQPATRNELESIRLDFDSLEAPVVMLKDGAELSSPGLSDALRAARYEKVLDGLPLTQPHFNDTPLAWLRDALARVAGLSGPW